MLNYLKKIVKTFLIKLRIRSRPTAPIVVRRDIKIIPIQPNLHLKVYWKVLDIGKGPAVILCAYENEIVKFDCFGEGKGHYHISPHSGLRIYFVEKSAKQQIQRSIQELLCNSEKYLKLQSNKKIQALTIDKDKLAIAIKKMEKQMLSFLALKPLSNI